MVYDVHHVLTYNTICMFKSYIQVCFAISGVILVLFIHKKHSDCIFHCPVFFYEITCLNVCLSLCHHELESVTHDECLPNRSIRPVDTRD